MRMGLRASTATRSPMLQPVGMRFATNRPCNDDEEEEKRDVVNRHIRKGTGKNPNVPAF